MCKANHIYGCINFALGYCSMHKVLMKWQSIQLYNTVQGEWPSDLYNLSQLTEVQLGRVRSDSGWVTSEAWPRNSPRRPWEGMLN